MDFLIFLVGLTDSLYHDLLQQTTNTLQIQQKPVFGWNEVMNELENYLTPAGLHGDTVSHPLLLRGPLGSGKTALAAVLANNAYSVPGWKVGSEMDRFGPFTLSLQLKWKYHITTYEYF